ncbi:S24 family peptidase [Daejeonella oryzae]|uniref:S24 family peptidase n=1 Tax=Daejeonella oryzae TaxID=1122943 RepID=UPI0003FD1589|nr:S24 family peptidase [Daejeonella oryzae]
MLRQIESVKDVELEPIADPGQVSGFQSPAADYQEDRLHILERLVSDPLNTFYFEAASDEMEQFGIKTGTLLVVDRSKKPSGGMIVIAWHHGEWLVRQLITHVKKKYLTTGKEEDEFVEVNAETGILIWGVVTWSCCPQMEVKKYVRTD